LAFMCHDSQPAVQGWLAEHGATVDDPRTIRRKVVASRGEHELEPEIGDLWALDDVARIAAAEPLVAQHPADPRLASGLAGAPCTAMRRGYERVSLPRTRPRSPLPPVRRREPPQRRYDFRTPCRRRACAVDPVPGGEACPLTRRTPETTSPWAAEASWAPRR